MTNWTFQNHQKKPDTFHSYTTIIMLREITWKEIFKKLILKIQKLMKTQSHQVKAHCVLAARKIAILIFKMHFGPIFCLSRTIKN